MAMQEVSVTIRVLVADDQAMIRGALGYSTWSVTSR